MIAALRAGVVYVAIVFAIGFALGAVRVFAVVPRLGETIGALVELPIILAASWYVCGRLLVSFAVPATARARLAMGGVAFVLLMIAELMLSIVAFGRSPAEHLASYRSWTALLGLAAQVVFATMPLLRLRR